MKIKILLTVLLILSISRVAPAGSDETMAWWRDAKFGLFVHWGPISILGKEISWCRGLPRPGEEYATWDRSVPAEKYDSLYKEFNPVKFDAEGWVRMMKDAGMKYIVFTTKHHDGFVNFDSKYTDYKITSKDCPFGCDIVGELAAACHRGGIGLGLYYSPPDWHHPEYLGPNHDTKYIEYFHGQIEELCKNYGKVDVFWFDGLRGNAEDWHAHEVVEKIKRWQPDALINNRLGVEGNMGTPEQSVGGFNRTRPWESCVTIGTQWTWGGNDKTKSYEECMKLLLNTVGRDGNLLLNVGPRPDGAFEPSQVAVIKRMGDWLKHYGDSIYATRGGPFLPGKFGVSTCKGNKIYVHVLSFDGDKVRLGKLPAKITAAKVLTGGECKVEQNENGVEIAVAKEHQQPLNTLIELTVDTDATGIAMISPLVPPEPIDLGHHSRPEKELVGKTPKVVFRNGADELVRVPAGEYVNRDGEKIALDEFYIQKHETTNAMYCEFLNDCPDAARHYNGRMQIKKKDSGGKATYSVEPGKENYPIVFVSYHDAEAYACWMSEKTGERYLLPSEAQWEKAAGWDDAKKHFYAYAIQTDEIRPHLFACSSSILFDMDIWGYAPIAVGSYDATSPVGCYDMSGNVREWTSSETDGKKITKGGSFWNYHTSCRTFSRYLLPPAAAGDANGFRLVCVAVNKGRTKGGEQRGHSTLSDKIGDIPNQE
ncbi:MAG: alpha-L-fucosidase [Pirellulales bacterium]|nr:alpha-L-fucosidase [Pirellulales bacterium]